MNNEFQSGAPIGPIPRPYPSAGLRGIYNPDSAHHLYGPIIDMLWDMRRLARRKPLGFGPQGIGGRGLGETNPGAPGANLSSPTDQMLSDYGRPTGP